MCTVYLRNSLLISAFTLPRSSGGPTAHSPLTFSTPASRGLCSQTKSLQQLLTHRQSAPAACYSLSANNYDCFAFAVAAAGKSVLQLQFLIGRLII